MNDKYNVWIESDLIMFSYSIQLITLEYFQEQLKSGVIIPDLANDGWFQKVVQFSYWFHYRFVRSSYGNTYFYCLNQNPLQIPILGDVFFFLHRKISLKIKANQKFFSCDGVVWQWISSSVLQRYSSFLWTGGKYRRNQKWNQY